MTLESSWNDFRVLPVSSRFVSLTVSMDWAFLVVLQILFQPSLSVLFIVEAEQTMYQSEFGEKVVMGCKFSPKPSTPHSDLKVIWRWTNDPQDEVVIRIDNGQELAASQKYQGRVRLLTDELKEGWAKLQVSNLRINDSGSYQCLVETAEGTDYKTIILSVKAPYKSVTKRIEKTADGDKVLLTCQSEGYPASSVTWHDKHLQRHDPNTTTELTPDQLYKITSQIQVNSSEKSNYTCTFTNDGYSATFLIPDEIPVSYGRSDALIVVLGIGVILIAIIVGVFVYRRQKGTSTSGTNCLSDGVKSTSADACLQIDKENKGEGSVLFEETRRHCFSVEELPHRL